jgi:hypothetical protein
MNGTLKAVNLSTGLPTVQNWEADIGKSEPLVGAAVGTGELDVLAAHFCAKALGKRVSRGAVWVPSLAGHVRESLMAPENGKSVNDEDPAISEAFEVADVSLGPKQALLNLSGSLLTEMLQKQTDRLVQSRKPSERR